VLRLALVIALVACKATPAPDAPSPPWTEGPMLPGPRLEPGVTALGVQVVMIGGFDTDVFAGLHITNEADVFDTTTNTWGMFPPAPVAWTHINLAAIGGQVYLLGGTEGTEFVAHGESFLFDPETNTWSTLATMPMNLERGDAAVIAAPGHIFLIGGGFTFDAVATCLDYDIANNSWSQLPDLPAKRSHPAGMRMTDGTLIVAGGLSTLDASEPLAETLALPVNATAWQPRMPMPVAHGGCAYGTLGGNLICAGGEAGISALHIVESYDPYLDQWSMLPDMPTERAGTQGAVVGQRLYVPGGAHELQFIPTSTLLVFSALDTAN
jgi:N-acetylneuraminic acid mutarotase